MHTLDSNPNANSLTMFLDTINFSLKHYYHFNLECLWSWTLV